MVWRKNIIQSSAHEQEVKNLKLESSELHNFSDFLSDESMVTNISVINLLVPFKERKVHEFKNLRIIYYL